MPIYSYLLTLFVLGTLSVTLDLDVKLCGQVSLGTEELCFAAVLVYSFSLELRCRNRWATAFPLGENRFSGGLVPVLSVPPPRGSTP